MRHRKARILMEAGKWKLPPGEALPELAPEPQPERPGETRICVKPFVGSTHLGSTKPGSGLSRREPQHGDLALYTRGCRCDMCVAGYLSWHVVYRAAKAQEDPPKHGTLSAYCIYACRCSPCRAVHRDQMRRLRKAVS